MKTPRVRSFIPRANLILLAGLLFAASKILAATVVWSGASGTDTNWSNGNNWLDNVAPGGGDDVKFYDSGTNLAVGVPNNLVDASFAGYIGSLQLGQSNGLHTIQISAGQTLNITNTGGLFVGTSGDVGAARALTNSIKGAGATLNINNVAANLVLNQGQSAANGSRAVLDLSGVDNFTANIFAIGVGSIHFQNAVAQRNSGILFLARTNNLHLNLTNTLANYSTIGTQTNAIELVHAGGGNNATALSFIYLGQTNAFYVDSLGFGRSKASAGSAATMSFNPAFANPSAFFRGVGGNSSRVTWWAIADMADNASSAQLAIGTNDFSLGTVDALVETMSLGRDCSPQHTSSGFNVGVLTFTAGTIDVNNLILGNQVLGPANSFAGNQGVVNVNGAAAKLVVNNTLELGHTTVTFTPGVGGTNAAKTFGVLNIRNGGTVLANNIVVGASSTNNNSLTMNSGTLIVSNSIATNSTGLYTLALTNATLGLTVPANGSLRGRTRALISGGATNFVQLDAAPVFFGSYPQQFPLIKYTTWTGTNNFGLTNVPAWAVGATLVSNGLNSSLDLFLPTDPRPVLTSQPAPYSGSPGDNVTSSLAVTIDPASVTPLGYQWYYVVSGVSTNSLANGPGPSGSSTISGSTTTNLQILNAQPADSGNYFVVATNVYGTKASSQATLTISAGAIPPTVGGPASQTATNGITTTITDTASGSPVPVVRWQFGGVDLADGPGPSGSSTISGSGTSTLTISNPQYPGDQGTYSLIASNSAGSATNSTVLTVIVPPVITSQPVSVVVTNTQLASFTVVVTGVPSPTYQWTKNGVPISSVVNPTATNATFTIASVSPADTATNYSVTISNPAGTTNSVGLSLIVNSTMAATAFSPANAATGVCYDTPLYITFNATPVLRSAGTVKIFNITNSLTPVDTINLSLGNLQSRSFAGDGQSFNLYAVIITGNTAAIYPHSGVMTNNQTYYVIVDNGVFADASGAYFAGISATNVWKFTTKPTGPANPTNFVVAADYSGDFATVQGAVDSVPSGNTTPRLISINNGNYVEVVNISGKHNVTFRGQNRTATMVGYANNANIAPGGTTHARMAFKMNANDIAIENLSITNRTPQGGSQAEALMIESGARRCIVNNADIASRQDTILANVNSSQAYFYNSTVRGNFDYIWGGGNLYFDKCVLHTISGASGFNLTAARTDTSGAASASTPWVNPNGTTYSANGFSFVNCTVEADAGVVNITLAGANGTAGGLDSWVNCLIDTNAYLSPSVTLSNSYVFWQNNNRDLTGSTPISFTNVQSIGVTNNDPRLLAATNVTTWFYGWTPLLAPNIIGQPVGQSVSAGQPANFTVAATGIPEPTYQWLKNGLPIPGAIGTNYTIASAVRTNAGGYSVVVNNGSGSVTSSVATLTYTGNVPPTANPSTYSRATGFSLKITIAGNLSTNWSDADGDALGLTGGITSTNGATVSYDSAYVYYSSANNVTDQINYTVGDGHGGFVPGVINVTVNAGVTAGNPQTISITGNSVTVNFAGIPGYQYLIQRSTNLVVWATLFTTNAPGNGVFKFTDDFGDLGGVAPPSAFYRTAHP